MTHVPFHPEDFEIIPRQAARRARREYLADRFALLGCASICFAAVFVSAMIIALQSRSENFASAIGILATLVTLVLIYRFTKARRKLRM